MACNQTYDGSRVFTGNPPGRYDPWEDLDLSSYVGSNRALVYLRVDNTSETGNWYQFRTKGLAREISEEYAGASACCRSDIDAGKSDYFLVETDLYT